ncbi:MAG: M23 family metallopeptidase [Spirochaetaceae bacterium]|nr:M23 family metallopeptidase [Spirochaetaceae bacterium]
MKKTKPNKSRLKHNKNSFMTGLKTKAGSLWYKTKEPLTIMVAPHSGAKVRQFRVSLLLLWVVIVLTLALVAGIVFFSTGYNDVRLSHIAERDRTNDGAASLALIQQEIRTISHVIPSFNDAINHAVGPVGDNRGLPNNNISGDISSFIEITDSQQHIQDDLLALRRLRAVIENSLPQLRTIHDTLNSQRALLSEMPTRWPLGGGYTGFISQLFGPSRDPFTGGFQFHTGIDIALGFGVPIVAAANGTVVRREFNAGGYGLYVTIRHSYGFSTLYAHMQRYNVDVGDVVRQGDVIGLMGSTGRSTGPHVHFEVMIGTERVDPMRYLSISNQAYSRFIRDTGYGRGF